MTDSKLCHLHSANIVKNLHARLRKKYKQCKGNVDDLWKEHCQDQQGLSAYASAMYHLATEHWSKKAETRIDWCANICLDYFLGGGIERILAKEQRRMKYEAAEMQTENIITDQGDTKNKDYINPSHDSFLNVILPPVTGKLRLLDVGSCYNPFKAYEQFIAVGIDISPASDSVICCDFLSLEIAEDVLGKSDDIDMYLKDLTGPLHKMPSGSFHVVVFSLLLEYLPCPKQRWICCEKANKLLSFNGLFIIVTPDSHAQHKNAPMIKSWRTAVELIGFERIKYSKLEHLHCMAFRKVSQGSAEIDKHMDYDAMFIPQDSNEIEEDEIVRKPQELTQEEEQELRETFTELPVDFDF